MLIRKVIMNDSQTERFTSETESNTSETESITSETESNASEIHGVDSETSEPESDSQYPFIRWLIKCIHDKHADDEDFEERDYFYHLKKKLILFGQLFSKSENDNLYQQIVERSNDYVEEVDPISISWSTAMSHSLKHLKSVIMEKIRDTIYEEDEDDDEDDDDTINKEEDALSDNESDTDESTDEPTNKPVQSGGRYRYPY